MRTLLAAVILVLGCARPSAPKIEAPSPPLTPVVAATNVTVLLDAKFSYLEASRLIMGFDAWVDALGPRTLQLHYGRIDGPVDKVAPEGTVNVARVRTMREVASLCPTGVLVVACWKTGERMMVVGVEAMTFDQLSTVATHELGHALGLDHREPPSIMASYVGKMALVPQKGDVEDYCRRHICY